MPVTANFWISHQWVRELRRSQRGPMVGVYFRIPDEEQVWAGRYNEQHIQMAAAQASAILQRSERLGFEVIVGRSIEPKEIHRIRYLPQGLGWRYYPEAHGNKPCGCPYCQYGQYDAKKLRKQYEDGFSS